MTSSSNPSAAKKKKKKGDLKSHENDFSEKRHKCFLKRDAHAVLTLSSAIPTKPLKALSLFFP
jgi:hypothetical protein